jgi:tyrosine-protein kinase Etk/Wzc
MANAYVEEPGNLLHQFAFTEAKQRRIFLEGQLNNANSNFRQVEQTIKARGINSSALKSTGAAVSEIAGLKGQITVQEIKLAIMRGYLTDAAPDFKQAQTELAALRDQLNRAAKAEPASTAASPSKSDYIAKYREYKYYETHLALFAS